MRIVNMQINIVDGCHKDNATLLSARLTFWATLLKMLNNMYWSFYFFFSFQFHCNQQYIPKKPGTFHQYLKIYLHFQTQKKSLWILRIYIKKTFIILLTFINLTSMARNFFPLPIPLCNIYVFVYLNRRKYLVISLASLYMHLKIAITKCLTLSSLSQFQFF